MSGVVLYVICLVAGWQGAKWFYILSGWEKRRKERKVMAEQTLMAEAALAQRYEREARNDKGSV